eukprot:Em0005g147a
MHKESIPYAIGLLEGIKLLGRPLTIRTAGANRTTQLPPRPPWAGRDPMELERSHHRHHESRLHSRDHPHWLKEDVRDRLSRYHQHELEREPHSRRSSHDEQSSYDRQSSHEGIHRRSSYEDSHRRSSHEGSHKHYH